MKQKEDNINDNNNLCKKLNKGGIIMKPLYIKEKKRVVPPKPNLKNTHNMSYDVEKDNVFKILQIFGYTVICILILLLIYSYIHSI